VTKNDLRYDFVIAGGGVAGAYCAYRLSAARPEARIALFEASPRIGGRLHSVVLPGVTAPAELGGAFVSDRHAHVWRLARELGLQLAPIAWSRRFSFLRGRRVADRTFTAAPDAIPYDLSPAERGQSPTALLRRAIDTIAPGLRSLPPGDLESAALYLRRRRFKARALDDLPFETVLRECVSDDALQCIVATFGSSANFGGAGCYDALLTLLDEFAPQQPFAFADGFERLPVELARRSKAEIQTSARLTALRAENESLRLTVSRAKRAELSVSTKALILALPPDALRRIDFGVTHEQARAFDAKLSNVASVSACKLFLSFDHPWWPDKPRPDAAIGMAASYTDQPMQQCYYYGLQGGGSALLLALFADAANASFWAPYFDADGAPTRAMIDAALAQLRAMHPDADIPEAAEAVAKFWPAAWHMWRPGARSWRNAPTMRGPHFNLPVYVCGEAFSTKQGWAEGALESAESLMRENFLA
jgi:lysine 2-monooxygenase